MALEVNMKEDLEKIYADVSEWVKFAEAKHAGAIVLWTALIAAAFTADKFYCLCDTLQICIFAALFFGMAISVFALMPFTNNIEWLKALCYLIYENKSDKQNAIFYRSIFVLVGKPSLGIDARVDNYKNLLKNKYGSLPQGALVTDYVKQIIQVSTVASIKTFLFSISTWYLLVFVIVSFLYIVIF